MIKEDLKILFLAKYAPNELDEFISQNPLDILYAKYHQDIFNILKTHFKNIVSATDPNYLQLKHNNIDYVFTLLNRMQFNNSEVFVSSVCEYYGLPYLGATPNIRAVAEDKHLAKILAQHLHMQTANWITVSRHELHPNISIQFPIFVKPRFGASSKWISSKSVCHDEKNAHSQIKLLQTNGEDVIVEQFLDGESYTVGVLNNYGKTIVLPPIKEESNGNVITYEEKRKIIPGLRRTICQDDRLSLRLKKLSKDFFESLQPMDYARFDYIVIEDNIYFIEFNLCCNLGRASAIAIAANSINIPYESLIENILFSSLNRQGLHSTPINQI